MDSACNKIHEIVSALVSTFVMNALAKYSSAGWQFNCREILKRADITRTSFDSLIDARGELSVSTIDFNWKTIFLLPWNEIGDFRDWTRGFCVRRRFLNKSKRCAWTSWDFLWKTRNEKKNNNFDNGALLRRRFQRVKRHFMDTTDGKNVKV